MGHKIFMTCPYSSKSRLLWIFMYFMSIYLYIKKIDYAVTLVQLCWVTGEKKKKNRRNVFIYFFVFNFWHIGSVSMEIRDVHRIWRSFTLFHWSLSAFRISQILMIIIVVITYYISFCFLFKHLWLLFFFFLLV